jgi:RND family efflux transporter MFP subunit
MKKASLFRAERRAGVRPARSRHRPGGPMPGSVWLFKRLVVATVILIALILSACTSIGPTPTAIPTISLSSNNNGSPSNNQSDNGDGVSASAIIVPVKNAELSFANVGRVKAVAVKVGDQVTEGQVLVELDTTLLEAKVKEAEANLAVAQVQVDYLKRVGTDEVHLESAQAETDRAQALLDSANAILATQSKLVAPFAGTIVSVDISPAETVVPGQIVIVLGDLSNYQIETTDLSERDVPRVQIGQPANVFIEALNEEFPGQVVDIDHVSSTIGGDVVFTVTIDLDRQPQGLLWGMSADVQIQTAD